MRWFLFLALISMPVLAGPIDAVAKNMAPWSPLSVDLSGKWLVITLDQPRITDAIYNAALMGGVCATVWSSSDEWPDIEEVRILNRFGRQGYVFEGGAPECAEVGELNGQKAKFFVLGRTRMF